MKHYYYNKYQLSAIFECMSEIVKNSDYYITMNKKSCEAIEYLRKFLKLDYKENKKTCNK